MFALTLHSRMQDAPSSRPSRARCDPQLKGYPEMAWQNQQKWSSRTFQLLLSFSPLTASCHLVSAAVTASHTTGLLHSVSAHTIYDANGKKDCAKTAFQSHDAYAQELLVSTVAAKVTTAATALVLALPIRSSTLLPGALSLISLLLVAARRRPVVNQAPEFVEQTADLS